MKSQENKSQRSPLVVMAKLIVLVKPLLPVMLLAITLGVFGFLCAIFLTVFASAELVSLMQIKSGIEDAFAFPLQKIIFPLLIILAVARGLLHYGEQYCNHYIAFKLLAIIRNKVFAVLRRLCPAKLEGQDKGNLISVITSDIELLEVFYAHTISPVAIAIIVSAIMCAFIGSLCAPACIIAVLAYITVGVIIPLINSRLGRKAGLEFRNSFGELNSFLFSSLRGLDETIQFDYGTKRQEQMNEKSSELGVLQGKLNKYEALQKSFTTAAILFFSLSLFILMLIAHLNGLLGENSFAKLVIATVSMLSSFGPVVALSNLSNNLNQTLASGNRVLDLLEESPLVEEVQDGKEIIFDGLQINNIDFAYDRKQILKNLSATITKGKLIGIHGQSGCGKSTLLKLIMRFWDVDSGSISFSNEDIKNLKTKNLRSLESYLTQEAFIFNGTIAENISLSLENIRFTRKQIVDAAKKASLHDFIITLPNGYDTQTGELGSYLSGGEKQRIGLARAFLFDAPLMLLDEPTSNLDSLNEAVILKSLNDERKSDSSKTFVLVSHRKSTLSSCEEIIEM